MRTKDTKLLRADRLFRRIRRLLTRPPGDDLPTEVPCPVVVSSKAARPPESITKLSIRSVVSAECPLVVSSDIARPCEAIAIAAALIAVIAMVLVLPRRQAVRAGFLLRTSFLLLLRPNSKRLRFIKFWLFGLSGPGASFLFFSVTFSVWFCCSSFMIPFELSSIPSTVTTLSSTVLGDSIPFICTSIFPFRIGFQWSSNWWSSSIGFGCCFVDWCSVHWFRGQVVQCSPGLSAKTHAQKMQTKLTISMNMVRTVCVEVTLVKWPRCTLSAWLEG